MKRVREQIGLNTQAVRLYTGNQICVAVLDSGIGKHPDLNGRILAFKDFTKKNHDIDYYDDYGHGTHAYGPIRDL